MSINTDGLRFIGTASPGGVDDGCASTSPALAHPSLSREPRSTHHRKVVRAAYERDRHPTAPAWDELALDLKLALISMFFSGRASVVDDPLVRDCEIAGAQ
jgi:hypothetical protein